MLIMRFNFSLIPFAFLFVLIVSRCAQIGPLSGGPRDTTPPKLLLVVPSNKSLNFNSEKIVLTFDEFVQLRDINNQLIITPSIDEMPDIETEGKTINIHFKKTTLQPNTTYRFFFGKAIADMNESNVLADFEYVFSTGNTIDTILVKGSITNASNNKPAGAITIGLYEDLKEDSIIYKKKPDYYSHSDEAGKFSLSYLPEKAFRVFAFSDLNKNGLYDGEAEKVAFINEMLKLNSDTSLKLRLFQELPSKNYIKKTISPYYGVMRIILNKPSRFEVKAINSDQGRNIFEHKKGEEKDTLLIFYKELTDSLKLSVVDLQGTLNDTLKTVLPKVNPAKKSHLQIKSNIENGTLGFHEYPFFDFMKWMDTTKTNISGIKLSGIEDSVIQTQSIRGVWQGVSRFVLHVKLREGLTYKLKVDSNVFTDYKLNTNDSVVFRFKTKSVLEFGKVTLHMKFNKKQNYLVQLINDKEKVVKETAISFSLSSSNAVSLDFPNMEPGQYQVRIVYDDNKNGKWDSGNLIKKIQAERVSIHSKIIKVTADWEIEEEISVNSDPKF
jgi:hypothetical protein